MDSLDQIKACIDEKKSFLLEAGAGSGKTWSLIESLKYIISKHLDILERDNKKIVCITYTNVAKFEIAERIDNHPLVIVLTIHEFLWDVIKRYQKELKKVLIDLNKDAKKKIESLDDLLRGKKIEYTQFGRNISEGRITHNDVIVLAHIIFEKYPQISKIVASKYPYIFVDEYQDTEESTVNLLIEVLLKQNEGLVTLGFFGDSMQKIYNKGIGAIESDSLQLITKEENYRCSKIVIDLLNSIRTNIEQFPAKNNKDGELCFIVCNSDLDNETNFSKTLSYLETKGWDLNSAESKTLMLTHKGIAKKLEYPNLLNVYDRYKSFGRDRLYEREEAFSKLLLGKIESACFLYQNRKFGEFLKLIQKEGFSVRRHRNKVELRAIMEELNSKRMTDTIGEVLEFVYEKILFVKTDRILDLENRINEDDLDDKAAKDKKFYDALMQVPYIEVHRLYNFIEDYTPFSTKHGVKGAEFENVLMVIDDGSWNQFSFNEVFSGDRTKKARFDRTLNLLYVCCSRAKNNLAVLALSNLNSPALNTVNEWFGSENVYNITDL